MVLGTAAAVLLAGAFLTGVLGRIQTIENENLFANFDTNSGALVRLVDKKTSVVLIEAADGVSTWNYKFVDKIGDLALGSRGVGVSSLSRVGSTQVLSLNWPSVSLLGGKYQNETVARISPTVEVSLEDSSPLMELSVSLQVLGGVPVGLWEAYVAVPVSIGNTENGELFYPTGFGVTFSNPSVSTGGSRSRTYPCGEGSMQFMALGESGLRSAVYVAALDGKGEAKNVQYFSPSKTGKKFSTLQFTVFPENAGVHLTAGSAWSNSYKVAVGVVSGVSAAEGRPLWHEAGLIYRSWALSAAHWTQKGPISARSEAFPAWYSENSIWLNTHWQCHDIFNETGGDPNFVLPYTKQIAERLQEPSLALHWYEWQQGPDPAPEARYKFDTHYPDYFPARVNFKEAVAGLLAMNVTTFPYINGRISDVDSDSFIKDQGAAYCSKETIPRLVDEHEPMPLKPYVESYGSGSTFCVTNPFTTYWQEKIADTVEELVFEYGVSGVYIDQIGSAVPKLCWDAVHEHSLGNGDFWTVGYEKMLTAINDRLKSTSARPMVTEDNAEPYMESIQGYLTLNAYKSAMAASAVGALSGVAHIAPAFPMIYGGYYVGFGAIWSRPDFDNHDWWCGKLASMFVTGSQLGWFSLAGIENDPEDSCGPMGVGDLMLSAENDDLIAYLRLLARSRAAGVKYYLDGHMVRPAVLQPEPPAQLYAPSGSDPMDFDSVASGVWKIESTGTVLAVFTTTTPASYSGTLTVDFSNWGYETVKSLAVWSLDSNGQKSLLGTVEGPKAFLPIALQGRSISMLEFVPV